MKQSLSIFTITFIGVVPPPLQPPKMHRRQMSQRKWSVRVARRTGGQNIPMQPKSDLQRRIRALHLREDQICHRQVRLSNCTTGIVPRADVECALELLDTALQILFFAVLSVTQKSAVPKVRRVFQLAQRFWG